MKTAELKRLLDVAEQLGQTDIPMKWEDGRDGISELIDVKATFYAPPGKREDGPIPKHYVLLITRD